MLKSKLNCFSLILSTLTYLPLLIFAVNAFVFISATCSSPLYVIQIKDPTIGTNSGSPRSEFNDTPVCCSDFLITKPNMITTCLEDGE